MERPHESIWGNINTCAEIGIEIYRLVCKNDKGETKTGVTIPTDRAKEALSEKALSVGTEHGGFINYESPNESLVPLYELMKSGSITDSHLANRLRDLDELERRGKAAVPSYFGSLPLPPPVFPNDDIAPPDPQAAATRTVTEIRSGLSVIKDAEHHFFIAVHKALALRSLTPDACGYGGKSGDFLLYGAISCSIPLHELSLQYPEIGEIVLNRESMEQTMVTKAPKYVDYWNENHAEPGREIKDNGSIPMLFLQEHLDYEADNTRSEVSAFLTAHAHEADRYEGLDEEVLELER